MYRYDEFDQRFAVERVAQFRDQVRRRLAGDLSEEEFRPLRLKNGVYLQLHAYMLRIAIPYGTLSSRQMRKLADLAERYDRGYGHFTTRQNLQLNWPKLEDVPDMLADLAEVGMHAIQTSGNCIRNVTTDHLAESLPSRNALHDQRALAVPEFGRWVRHNTAAHKVPGYRAVTVSLKPIGGIPGDATSEQMRVVAALADGFSHGEVRVSHEQNLILPDVKLQDLFAVWNQLDDAGLATANAGLVSDIISCPGLDYCSLATARSIPIVQAISRRFADPARQERIGELKIKISGCINACGHHHVGHIGILGLDKQGREFYQITLGGSGDEQATIGKIAGPGFSAEEVPVAVERLIETYLTLRRGEGESFLEAYRRLGDKPFKEKLYAAAQG